MEAKDYQICPALFNAYIAKVSKKSAKSFKEFYYMALEKFKAQKGE